MVFTHSPTGLLIAFVLSMVMLVIATIYAVVYKDYAQAAYFMTMYLTLR